LISQRVAGSEAEAWPRRSCPLLFFFPLKFDLFIIQLGQFTPVSLAVHAHPSQQQQRGLGVGQDSRMRVVRL